ncbi:sensor histidine kinase [Streptomyces viridochromogenes]|uniref:Oxygen sensor histidine kinase NreB n=1 Tax=Streptomyces viridochromogenes Tue57 TaxID=1160705 RepID=L8P3X7_STRVR|nr:sensor histidine kinase [Streptomyces viridochromogenes]ELS50843.1 putative Two-component system histidine kinase [Streptomyces viridochromogenes Tue57]
MSDPGLVNASAPADHRRFGPRQLPHLVFFIVVGAAVVRLAHLNIPLCWEIVTVSGLLAVTYAGGLVLGSKLGRRARNAWVAVLLLLWAVLVLLTPPPFTGAYVWCAVPLACVALSTLSARAAGAALAAVTALLVGQLTRTAGGFDPEMVLIPVAAVWGTVALYRTQQRNVAERQRLVEELRSTRDVLADERHRSGALEERARIARDLHDTLAQELSGSLMLLQAAERDWDERPEVARTRVRAVADGLDAGLAETRRIIQDLSATEVAEAGLEGSLRLLCARVGRPGGVGRVQFRTAGGPAVGLDEQTATTLFRVAQSVLANVREHAHATTVSVTLRHLSDRVELDVCDDGVGFDPDRIRESVPPGRGFGLLSTRERLRRTGGDLAVHSAPGRGTRIRATVPACASRPCPALPLAAAAAR